MRPSAGAGTPWRCSRPPAPRVVGIDQDDAALDASGAAARVPGSVHRGAVEVRSHRFDQLAEALDATASTQISGALFDLGVSLTAARPGRPRLLATATTRRSTCAWIADQRRPRPTWSTATTSGSSPTCSASSATSASPAASPGPSSPPAPSTTTAELAEIVRTRDPRAGPPHRRPPGQAHVPGHPHRGQPRARGPARGARPGDRGARARRPHRRARLPLG